MGTVTIWPGRDHARTPAASTGYKSGRNSLREMPVSLSIDKTNSAGTPRLDLWSQYQTCDCVVPIRSASGFWPPATSQARLRASLVMKPEYSELGGLQPKYQSRTTNREIGKVRPMDEVIDPKAVGQRMKRRRNDLGLSQAKIGAGLKARGLRGYSQQNIVSLESGIIKDPRQAAADLAGPLQTSVEWLLYERGPKEIRPPVLTGDQFEELPLDFRVEVTELWARRPRQQQRRA
jgi:transcriptional regulator with XRE-family HTH domain